jgi:hypothetical protein
MRLGTGLDCKDYCLLRYDAMFSGRRFPIFRRAEGGRFWYCNFQDSRMVIYYPTDVGFFETNVCFYKTTRRHIPQDRPRISDRIC